ncbi:DUF2948 family protein [Rhodovulum adriaticum]|uniref:DUF2948 family protein n=1 Tax=Rhodovulum adriaticum TaxID=35804 RepID=A0A4R2NWZ5_RHOAD|nr:DUF2948 family protein [Rhodovulum adriaticum]MBK1636990.1 hypothetical protein [Rhodovulum adriaticum]TCP26547.1 DUF2948 family protein [Rhodovulum adriaticum]
MTGDARFEDGAERPLRLMAVTAEDLQVLSALVQDAVMPVTEMRWDRARRRFAVLVNRFRWEDRAAADRMGRPYERVQAVLSVEDVQQVASQGFDRGDRDLVLSLLSVSFEPGTDGGGRVVLTLAGDGAIALDVECLEVTLNDVTRPYTAPSGKAPQHP